MCFKIQRGCKNSSAKIAEEDFRVYKVLTNLHFRNGRLLGEAPNRGGYYWKANKLTRAKITPTYTAIERGLHAYINLSRADWKRRLSDSIHRVICECIIPKGTKYYINTANEEIVAEKMIWTGRVYSLSSKRWVEFGRKIK